MIMHICDWCGKRITEDERNKSDLSFRNTSQKIEEPELCTNCRISTTVGIENVKYEKRKVNGKEGK